MVTAWVACPHCRLRFLLGLEPAASRRLQCGECMSNFWAVLDEVPGKGGMRPAMGITHLEALERWHSSAELH